MRRVERRASALAVLIGLMAPVATAHELGTTQVSAVFRREASFDITIVTDAAALVEKLETVDGVAVGSANAAADLRRRLQGHQATFLERVGITFNGTVVQPSVEFNVADGTALDPPVATITLRGNRPSSTAAFQWSYGWTFTSYALRVSHPAVPEPVTAWLEGGTKSDAVALDVPRPPPGRLEIVRTYLGLGFTHIVPGGLDHVLFVLGIILLSRRPRQILTQVTAFTLAHSLTLALSVYGVVTLSPRLVEPLIAISIAYVAIENMLFTDLQRWRVGLVFIFGLLHGLGFPGVLADLGLPRSEFLAALVGFNLGVEAGQLVVIATAFLLIGWSWAPRTWYRTRVVVPASAMIACTAIYWTVTRLQ